MRRTLALMSASLSSARSTCFSTSFAPFHAVRPSSNHRVAVASLPEVQAVQRLQIHLSHSPSSGCWPDFASSRSVYFSPSAAPVSPRALVAKHRLALVIHPAVPAVQRVGIHISHSLSSRCYRFRPDFRDSRRVTLHRNRCSAVYAIANRHLSRIPARRSRSRALSRPCWAVKIVNKPK